MNQICFATNNTNKIKEVRLASGSALRILTLHDIQCFEDLPETCDTLEDNSIQKAAYVFEKYNTPCFADDTGLEVKALQGAPGVYSARYAGEHKNNNDNVDLLLKNLQSETDRTARFRTVITLVGVVKEPVTFEGIIQGEIIREKRGTLGFGYDCVFIPQGYTRTFAEMSIKEKNSISHRSIAVSKLADYLKHKQ